MAQLRARILIPAECSATFTTGYSSAPAVTNFPTVDLGRFGSLAVPMFVHPVYWKIRRETQTSEGDVFTEIHDHDFEHGESGSPDEGDDGGDVEEGGGGGGGGGGGDSPGGAGGGGGAGRPPSPVRFGPGPPGHHAGRSGGGYRVPSPHRGSPSRQSHHSSSTAQDYAAMKHIRSVTPCMLVEAIADRPFKEQLRSPQFVGITLFFSVNLTLLLFFFSTVLTEVPWNREETKAFTQVVTFVGNGVPVLLTPFAGALMGRFGFGVSTALTNLFAVLMFVVLVVGKTTGSLPVCIVAVVFFALQRTLTFSIFFSYVALVFGGANYGKLVGLATVVAALVGCLNYAFTFWAGAKCQHCEAVNILLAAVVVPLFWHSWKLWGWEKE